MKFKSKVDWYVYVACTTLIIAGVWWTAVSAFPRDAICGCVLVSCGIAALVYCLNMGYILSESGLVIKFADWGKGRTIAYSDIISAGASSADLKRLTTALSFDSVEIKYKTVNKNSVQVIYVSPKNKIEFLKLLEEKRV